MSQYYGWAAVVLTIMGGSYILSGDIHDIRDAYLKDISTISSRVSANEERINALEKTTNEHYTQETSFEAYMRSWADTMISQVADLKVLAATHGK